MRKDRSLTVRLPAAQVDWLMEQAKRLDRSVAFVVRYAVSALVASELVPAARKDRKETGDGK